MTGSATRSFSGKAPPPYRGKQGPSLKVKVVPTNGHARLASEPPAPPPPAPDTDAYYSGDDGNYRPEGYLDTDTEYEGNLR
jgi:hypothetical protein